MGNRFKRIAKSTSFPAFVLFAAFIVINILVTKNFLTLSYMKGVAINNAPLICLTMGMSVVIISGGIDLSLGTLLSVVNTLCVTFTALGWNPVLVILVCLLVGAGIGMINGLVVGYLRIPPLLATFAMSTILEGLALIILPKPGGNPDQGVMKWYRTGVLGVPIATFAILLVALTGVFILKSKFGILVRATGYNEKEAFFSGIHTGRIKLYTYMIAGLFGGLGGILMTYGINSADATIGTDMCMQCIAACVIGGVDLAGGQGHSLGALWGILFLTFVSSVIVSLGLDTFSQSFWSGMVLLISLLGSVILMKRSKKAIGLD